MLWGPQRLDSNLPVLIWLKHVVRCPERFSAEISSQFGSFQGSTFSERNFNPMTFPKFPDAWFHHPRLVGCQESPGNPDCTDPIHASIPNIMPICSGYATSREIGDKTGYTNHYSRTEENRPDRGARCPPISGFNMIRYPVVLGPI